MIASETASRMPTQAIRGTYGRYRKTIEVGVVFCWKSVLVVTIGTAFKGQEIFKPHARSHTKDSSPSQGGCMPETENLKENGLRYLNALSKKTIFIDGTSANATKSTCAHEEARNY